MSAMTTTEAGRIALSCMHLVIDNSTDTQLAGVGGFNHASIEAAIDKIEDVANVLGIG